MLALQGASGACPAYSMLLQLQVKSFHARIGIATHVVEMPRPLGRAGSWRCRATPARSMHMQVGRLHSMRQRNRHTTRACSVGCTPWLQACKPRWGRYTHTRLPGTLPPDRSAASVVGSVGLAGRKSSTQHEPDCELHSSRKLCCCRGRLAGPGRTAAKGSMPTRGMRPTCS